MTKTAKLFITGGSQAMDQRDLAKLRKTLRNISGSCPDFPDIPPPPGVDVPRDLEP